MDFEVSIFIRGEDLLRYLVFAIHLAVFSSFVTSSAAQTIDTSRSQAVAPPSGTDLALAASYFQENYPTTYEIIWANPTSDIVKASQVEIARALIKVLGQPSVSRVLAERLQVEFPALLAGAMSRTSEEWLRSGGLLVGDVSQSVAEGMAVKAAAALATDLLFRTPPMRNTHPQLEGPLRVIVETTIVEMYDAQKALRDPSVLLGKFLDRYDDIVTIYQSTFLVASVQKQALVAAVLATENAALAAAEIGGERGDEILVRALEFQKVAPISLAVGDDDGEAVDGILTMGLQALYAYYRGDRTLARQQAEIIRQLGDAGANIHPFSAITKPLDWAVTVINMGKDSPEIAAELFLGSTALVNLFDLPLVQNTEPAQILYSSLGDGEVYGEYEEVLPQARVDQIVGSVNPRPSAEVAEKFGWAASEVFLADIRSSNPVAEFSYERVMAFATGLDREDRARILILAAIDQLANEHGLTINDIELLNNGRNINQSEIHSFTTVVEDIDGSPGWVLRPAHESVFHAFGYDPADIRKYTHAGGCEYIFKRTDGGWEFLNDGVNTGTFNYSDGAVAHTLLDIFPWILWGVGAEERRTFAERLRLAQENGAASQISVRLQAALSGDASSAPPAGDVGECGSRPGEPIWAWDGSASEPSEEPLDPNALFVEAMSLYRSALEMEGDEQLAALAQVRANFDLIVEEFPETHQAQAILGKSVPSIDFEVLERQDKATKQPGFDIGIEVGLYAIDPALCALADTVGDTWGMLFQSVTASAVSRGYERDCRLTSVTSEGDLVSFSAECSVEGTLEAESWKWQKTSETSFVEEEGRNSGKRYALCLSPPTEAASSAPSTVASGSGEWGPGIVPSVEVGYNPCGERDETGDCLRALGLSEEAIRFSFEVVGDYSGTSVATSFKELGEVDLAVQQWIGADIHFFPVLLNGPLGFHPVQSTRSLAGTFADEASQAMLKQFPTAQNFAFEIRSQRRLPDGAQRFVLMERVTEQCRVCPILGSAVTFLDIGPSTNGVLSRRPIGLLLGRSEDSADMTADVIRTRPESLQVSLNALGYDAGPMDGYPGPQTRQALMEFQVEHCLPPTGQPDAVTIDELLKGDPFLAPCAGKQLPDGINANNPLLAGVYVDNVASCESGNVPYETQHLSMRIIRAGSITYGAEGGCETRRTDIRENGTLFRGTCSEGNQSFDASWTFDLQGPEHFIDVTMGGQGVPPRRFVKCDDNSPMRRQWAPWFGDSPTNATSQSPVAATPSSEIAGYFEPARGTDLRTDILNAVRPIAEAVYGPPVEFVVDTMRVSGDRAFVDVFARRPGGTNIQLQNTPAYRSGSLSLETGDPDSIDALLLQVGGVWRVERSAVGASEAWWLDDCEMWGVLFPQQCGVPEQTASLEVSSPVERSLIGTGQPVARVVVRNLSDQQVERINHLTETGFVPGSPDFRMPRMEDARRGMTAVGALPFLDRQSVSTALKEILLGAWYVDAIFPTVSSDLRISESNLHLVARQLEILVRASDSQTEQSAIARINALLELDFQRMSGHDRIEPRELEWLRFASDLGYRAVSFWQVGRATSDIGWVPIMSFGLPRPDSTHLGTPALDPSGIMIGLIRPNDVLGIFEAGPTAEVEFTLESIDLPMELYDGLGTWPSRDFKLDSLVSRANELGLRTSAIISFPAGGNLETQRIDMGSPDRTYTAIFRKYDDGWRFWRLR